MKGLTWTLLIAALVTLGVVASLNPGSSLRQIEAGDDFRIDPVDSGICGNFEYRSQMTRVDAPTGAVEWQTDIPWSWVSDHGMAVEANTIAFSAETGMGAIDAGDGSALWQVIDPDQVNTVVAADASLVLSKSGFESDSVLTARNITDGEQQWSREFAQRTAWSFALLGDLAVVNELGVLVATDIHTAETAWTVATAGDNSFGPVSVGDYLFYSAYQHGLYRLDARSGAVLWLWEPPARAAVDGTVAVVGDVVFFGTSGAWLGGDTEPPREADRVVAVDLESGRTLWSVSRRITSSGGDDYPGDLLFGTGAIALAGPRALSALDLESGRIRWSWSNPSVGQLSIDDAASSVFIGSGNSVTAVDRASGDLLWEFSFSEGQLTVQVAPDLGLLVGQSRRYDFEDRTPGGVLYLLDPDSGTVMWERPFRDGVDLNNVLRYQDSLIVRSADPTIGCD